MIVFVFTAPTQSERKEVLFGPLSLVQTDEKEIHKQSADMLDVNFSEKSKNVENTELVNCYVNVTSGTGSSGIRTIASEPF